MKIITQNYKNGTLEQVEVPKPANKSGFLTVETKASLLSVGTEKAMIDVAQKSMLGKALARPDWVKQVWDKVRTEGLSEAWRQSNARLDTPVPLGYSASGIVTYSSTSDFIVGQRVVCTGSGYASHAEYIQVPPNLCTTIPEGIDFNRASYAALGGIAMEAVRLAEVELGHRVGVIGLGLLGQLTTQILASAGCHVVASDIDSNKCSLAQKHGAELTIAGNEADIVERALNFSNGYGLDSVIIMASTSSNRPLEDAAEMTRERGTVVASGLVGLEIPRKIFFEKELNFRVSRAWGPGALDIDYTERNAQWPYAYVRWSARRNIEEFLSLLSKVKIDIDSLTTHTYPFNKAIEAYELVLKNKEPYLGVVLEYGKKKSDPKTRFTIEGKRKTNGKRKQGLGIGFIGAGLFTRGTLLPAIRKNKGFSLEGLATTNGLNGRHIAEKFGFSYSTTNYKDILQDTSVDTVFVLTRHNSHARFLEEVLVYGKHVYVEKPLCIKKDELISIYNTVRAVVKNNDTSPKIMVGFNRRFSPAAREARRFIEGKESGAILYLRCNAGAVPKDSWIHQTDEGGGRIVGELCHFVDLAQYLTGSAPKTVFASSTPTAEQTNDNLSVTLSMENGAAVSIVYTSAGSKTYPREEVQIYAGGGVFHIHNFKTYERYIGRRKKKWKGRGVDRGIAKEMEETVRLFKEDKSPIDFSSLFITTATTFAVQDSIVSGKAFDLSHYIEDMLNQEKESDE